MKNTFPNPIVAGSTQSVFGNDSVPGANESHGGVDSGDPIHVFVSNDKQRMVCITDRGDELEISSDTGMEDEDIPIKPLVLSCGARTRNLVVQRDGSTVMKCPIITSPNGTKYKLTVDNDGDLHAQPVT